MRGNERGGRRGAEEGGPVCKAAKGGACVYLRLAKYQAYLLSRVQPRQGELAVSPDWMRMGKGVDRWR